MSLRKKICLVIGIILTLLLLTPGVSAYAEKLNLGSQEIIMNMSWPEPDDVHYCDTPPCYMRIMGQVFGSDIQNVTVTHANNTQECGYDNGKYFLVNCNMEVTGFLNDQVDCPGQSGHDDLGDEKCFFLYNARTRIHLG